MGWSFTTEYHLQVNGQVKSLNHTLINSICTYTDFNPATWDRYLESIVFAYLTTPQYAGLNEMPFVLIYGRDLHLPWNILRGSIIDIDHNLHMYKLQITGNLHHTQNIICAQLWSLAELLKLFHDPYHNVVDAVFPEGLHVLLFNPQGKHLLPDGPQMETRLKMVGPVRHRNTSVRQCLSTRWPTEWSNVELANFVFFTLNPRCYSMRFVFLLPSIRLCLFDVMFTWLMMISLVYQSFNRCW